MKRLSWNTITVLCGIGVILSSNSLFGADGFGRGEVADISTLPANLEKVAYAFNEEEAAAIHTLLPIGASSFRSRFPDKISPSGQRTKLTQAATDRIREGLKKREAELNLNDDDINSLLLAINYGVAYDSYDRFSNFPLVEGRIRLPNNSWTGKYFTEALNIILKQRGEYIKG